MGDILNIVLFIIGLLLIAILSVYYITLWTRYKRIIGERLKNDPSAQCLKVSDPGTLVCSCVCFFDIFIGLASLSGNKPLPTSKVLTLMLLAMCMVLFIFTIYLQKHAYFTAEGIYYPFLKRKYGFILKSTDVTYKITDNKLEIFAPDGPRPNVFYIRKNRGEILTILTENYKIRV